MGDPGRIQGTPHHTGDTGTGTRLLPPHGRYRALPHTGDTGDEPPSFNTKDLHLQASVCINICAIKANTTSVTVWGALERVSWDPIGCRITLTLSIYRSLSTLVVHNQCYKDCMCVLLDMCLYTLIPLHLTLVSEH